MLDICNVHFVWVLILCCLLFDVVVSSEPYDWAEIDLPEEHVPYFFNSRPRLWARCKSDTQCPHRNLTGVGDRCWGYEENCSKEKVMQYPDCFQVAPSLSAWMRQYNAQTQEEVFWKQADFGYVQEKHQQMFKYCEPQSKGDSSLECCDYLRYCKGRNIYMDFREHPFSTSSNRYDEDIFKPGQIGGHCKVDKDRLEVQGEHKSPLQSWYAELQHFTSLDFRPNKPKHCDIIVDKPTVVMKLDAGVNMYHHFCDFLNLYLSQHTDSDSDFSRDINIVNWDTSYMKYGDLFSKTWDVFTEHPVKYLREYAGKRVCFKNVLFPFLPRMRYGLFYNTPLIKGCKDTGLFRSFQQHLLHRLNIEQKGPLKDKVRITLLYRGTKYRRILNLDEIHQALNAVDEYEVTVVNYNHTMPFEQQVATSANSDVLMGMHGSGLTHMLFQPDWATVFEIYNCDDVNCYKDLAHLRGLQYFTWEKEDLLDQEDEGHHPTMGAHKKFTNYSFDVAEFKRIVDKMADYVKRHSKFREARRLKYGRKTDDTDSTAPGNDSPKLSDHTEL